MVKLNAGIPIVGARVTVPGHRPRSAMPATALDSKSNQQETAMRRLRSFAVVVGLMLSTSIIADSKRESVQEIEALPRDVEMELASSALPAPLQEAATIYVLDPHKGFVVARKGTNGFHALVARTGDDAFRGSWPLIEYPQDVLYPIGFDAAGATTHMQVFVDAAQAQANGMPAGELKKLIQERFKTGHYKPPARAGLSYMLAPIMRTYDDPETSPKISTASHPHVMYFAPNVSGQEIGSGELGGVYPHIIMPGPHGLIVQALDTKEKAAINKQHAGLLQKLCKIKQAWCLPKEQVHHSN
jgi:hypothetical protein